MPRGPDGIEPARAPGPDPSVAAALEAGAPSADVREYARLAAAASRGFDTTLGDSMRLVIALLVVAVPLVVYLLVLVSSRSGQLKEAHEKLAARERELEELSDILLQLDSGDTMEEVLRAVRARHGADRIRRRARPDR